MISEYEQNLLKEEGVIALQKRGLRGKGVTVAVVDTGVRPDDPDMRLITQVDFTGENEQSDPAGHGTQVAKLILQYAPEADLVSLRVVDRAGFVTRKRVIQALEYCINHYPKVRLVNASIGIRRRFWLWKICTFEKQCVLCRRVTELAVYPGLIVVAAAGNLGPQDDTITCPGMSIGAYTIAALLDPNFYISGEAARGPMRAGTSIAAARVTGRIALLLCAFPDLCITTLREAIKATASPISGAAPNQVGAGRGHAERTYDYVRELRKETLATPPHQ